MLTSNSIKIRKENRKENRKEKINENK